MFSAFRCFFQKCQKREKRKTFFFFLSIKICTVFVTSCTSTLQQCSSPLRLRSPWSAEFQVLSYMSTIWIRGTFALRRSTRRWIQNYGDKSSQAQLILSCCQVRRSGMRRRWSHGDCTAHPWCVLHRQLCQVSPAYRWPTLEEGPSPVTGRPC